MKIVGVSLLNSQNLNLVQIIHTIVCVKNASTHLTPAKKIDENDQTINSTWPANSIDVKFHVNYELFVHAVRR